MEKQTPRIPLQNHLITVRPSGATLPLARSAHHFERRHEEHLHEVDGEDCHEVPLELLAGLVNKYKDSLGAVTVLLDVIANRGLGHDIKRIRAGETDPKAIFWQDWDDEMKAPAQSFVVTAAGKTIVPLDLKTICDLYGLHHEHATLETHPAHPSRGGDVSLDAIKALDELVRALGLEPNHPFIRKTHCATCGHTTH